MKCIRYKIPEKVNLEDLGDKNFVFDQAIPDTVWYIVHNLKKKPSPVIVDSAGTEIEGQIDHIDINTLTITFNTPVSGKAHIN